MPKNYQGTRPLISANASKFPKASPGRVANNPELNRLNSLLIQVDGHIQKGNQATAKETLSFADELVESIDLASHVAHQAYNDAAGQLSLPIPHRDHDTVVAITKKLAPFRSENDESLDTTLDRVIDLANAKLAESTTPVEGDEGEDKSTR